MLISLIICTKNRCAALRTCLEYVARLEFEGEWELIVVDNGSTDGTSDLLKRFAEKARFPVVLVYEPKPGLGRARNVGIVNATGEILAFTDDDCYVSPDFLARTLEVFKDDRIGFMGGRVLLYDESDAPVTIKTETEIRWIAPYSFIRGELVGANMAARRSLVEKVGRFDAQLGAGTPFPCEDVEFLARASHVGALGVYHPGPLVLHHHGRKRGEDSARLRIYDYGRGAYYAKFILNPQTRIMLLKRWYWNARREFPSLHYGTILRQTAGAIHYLFFKLFQYRKNSSGNRV